MKKKKNRQVIRIFLKLLKLALARKPNHADKRKLSGIEREKIMLYTIEKIKNYNNSATTRSERIKVYHQMMI